MNRYPTLQIHPISSNIIDDVQGCSALVNEPKSKPASPMSPEYKFVPYRHPHQKNWRNFPKNQNSWKDGNYAFITLQKRCEIQNRGPMPTTWIDCGWIDDGCGII